MFMRDDRILQNFCWMPEAKWRDVNGARDAARKFQRGILEN